METHTGRILLPAVTPQAAESLSSFRQGEIVELASLAIHMSEFGGSGPAESSSKRSPGILSKFLNLRNVRAKRIAAGGGVTQIPTPNGVVVLSQTCDIVQSDRLTVQVAPLVPLEGNRAREAASGRRPQYIPVANAGGDLFADLERIGTIHKNDIANLAHRPGVNTPSEGRRLAQAIGRRFTRFPFPDNLHPWLRPLEDVLQKKANSPDSPEGQALQKVVEIRIEAEGRWDDPEPYNLTVLIVVEPGTLPYSAVDTFPTQSDALSKRLRTAEGKLSKSAGEIADELNATTDPADRYYLWLALGEAWAAKCKPPRGADQEVLDAVASLEGEIVSADELTMDRWWGSEALDLDHLSAPRPE